MSSSRAGWALDNFTKHPIALFNHDRDQVIGTWRDVAVKGGKLMGRLVLAEQGTSPLVDAVRSLVRQNILRAVSVGFRALQKPRSPKRPTNTLARSVSPKPSCWNVLWLAFQLTPNALAVAKELPRDVMREIFRKPATENFDKSDALTRKPAKPLAPARAEKMSNTSTVAARILHAQDEMQVLRDALKALSEKEEMNAEDTQRYSDLPKQIAAAKEELEKHVNAERALMDDIANNRQVAVREEPAGHSIPATGNAAATAADASGSHDAAHVCDA